MRYGRHALEAGEARAAALELVEEIRHDLGQGQGHGHEDAARRELPTVARAARRVHRVPVEVRPTMLEAEVHHRTEVFCTTGPLECEGRKQEPRSEVV